MAAAPKPRSRARRILRGVAWAVLGPLTAIVALLLVAVAIIFTTPGQSWLRRFVVKQADQALMGSLELGTLKLDAGGWLRLRDVKLRDPHGDVVASADLVAVQVDALAALQHRIWVKHVQLERPQLWLRVDKAGNSNLQAALAPRNPKPEQPEQQPSAPWKLQLDALVLRDGTVDRQDASNPKQPLHVESIDVSGCAIDVPGHVHVALQATANVTQPEKTPLAIDIGADGTGTTLDDKLELQKLRIAAGETTVEVTGGIAQQVAKGELAIHVKAAMARALGAPLARDLDVKASGTWKKGADAVVDVAVPQAHGGLALHADVTPEAQPLRYDARLSLEHFDPGALVTTAPNGDLNGTLGAKGNGLSFAQIAADVNAHLRASRVRETQLKSLDAVGRLADGVLTFASLTAVLPGGTIEGKGHTSMEQLAMDLDASVPDLGAFTANLGLTTPWIGAIEAKVQARGATRAPSITAAIRGPRLSNPAMDFDLHDLAIDAKLPDARKPTVLSARVQASRAHFQQQLLVGFAGTVKIDGERFDAALGSTGANALKLEAHGAMPDAHHVLALDDLQLGQGSSIWKLQQPAKLELAHGARVDHADLANGPQHIVIEGGMASRRFDLRAKIHALDLSKLPAIAVPPKLALQGRVDADVTVTGSNSDPRVDAGLQLHGLTAAALAARTHDRLDARLQARVRNRRASGTGELTFAKDRAQLDFDLPIDLAARADTKLSARVHTENFDLAPLAALSSSQGLELRGKAAMELALDGTLARPHVDGNISLRGVRANDAPPIDVTARLTAESQARLVLDVKAPKGKLHADASIPLPSDPIRHPDRVAAISSSPFVAKAQLEGLDLDAWRATFGIPPDADGVISAQLDAHGTAKDPRGTLVMDARQIVYGHFKDLDAHAELAAGDSKLTARTTMHLHGEPIVRLDADLRRALSQLIADPESLGATPVTVSLRAGPLDLARAQGPKPRVTGTFAATVDVSGTLDAPALHAHATGTKLAFSASELGDLHKQVPLGDLHTVLDAAGSDEHFVLTLQHLNVEARAQQELGLTAVQSMDAKQIPIDMSLVADHFDLGTLSGVSTSIHSLGGILTAHAKVNGPLGDPAFQGDLALTQGKLIVSGFGDFHDIAVQLSANNTDVKLSQLEIHAADGWAKLNFDASRPDVSQPFALAGELHAKGFPVESQDETLAYLDGDAKLKGTLASRNSQVLAHFSRIVANVPQLTHKPVQSLAPNPDIIVLGRTPKNKKPAVVAAANPKRGAPGSGVSGAQQQKAATQAAQQPADTATQKIQLGFFAPAEFLVRGSDINLDLESRMGVLIEPGSATPVQITPPPGMRETSYVRAVRGWVTVMGRKFEVPQDKRARIDFEGGDPTNANMDMNLVYNDRADQIKVNVAVTGPISDPNPPTLSSDPPMDQSQLALLVATGHLQTKRNAGQVSGTAQAGTIVASMVTGQIQKAVSKSLPLDTVSLETNAHGEISAEVGKYLTDRIYLGYTHNFASELTPGSLENQDKNINEFDLQYQLSRRWQLEATGGEEQGGVDAIWQKDY